eukprot:TRINITY_DN110721_c0_g1_i1.p1 TRINITY_DN110721_c0_g1~~TRINITY_DN110721_c0_g1_i1.p1  ORF type:complete len:170 (+),score=59.68 TRINITY_DN110721_c0_g1_i1:101-610(+)
MAAVDTLFSAAAAGNIDVMNKFLDSDEAAADEDYVDRQDEKGWTAMHHVASTNEAAAGALLAECGANTNVTDCEGNAPLHIAAIHGSRLVASMLLWGGGECDLENEKGNNPLHEAALHGSKDVAWLIVENGRQSAKDKKNKDGKLPADLAREAGHMKVAEVIETGDHQD